MIRHSTEYYFLIKISADTVIPPTPIDVEAFCSAVVWRTSLSSCDDTVTSYQVQFYIPGTSQTVTRTISSSSIFHYVIQDQDTFNIPENTLIRVCVCIYVPGRHHGICAHSKLLYDL